MQIQADFVNGILKNPYEKLSMRDFANFPIEKWNQFLQNRNSNYWEETGKKMALNLFQLAAERVPAYKDFLQKEKINPSKIKTYEDFMKIPAIGKKNYLQKYPLDKLVLDGKLEAVNSISVSSGSTGAPFLWPRGEFQELDTALSHELFLRYIFKVNRRRTLLIVAYSMGMYVAGPFTYSSALKVSLKGYPLSVVTPGINKRDVVRTIDNLSGYFEQVILAGYPPFVKDILDECERRGTELDKWKFRFIFGAESFSEEWREYILSRVNAGNPYNSSMNTYGSADAAILGHESPLTIFIRKQTESSEELRQKFFGDKRLPSLHQYNPLLRFFETDKNKDLLFTAPSGIPLIRYRIGDTGGLLSYKQAEKLFSERNTELEIWRKEQDLQKLWRLPLVYLFGRSDFTITLYGLNIYPENIKAALLEEKMVKFFTGKFVLSQEYNQKHDQFMRIRLELKKEVRSNKELAGYAQKTIVKTLKQVNHEYNRLLDAIGDRAKPKISIEEYGNRRFFTEGVKQPWVKK